MKRCNLLPWSQLAPDRCVNADNLEESASFCTLDEKSCWLLPPNSVLSFNEMLPANVPSSNFAAVQKHQRLSNNSPQGVITAVFIDLCTSNVCSTHMHYCDVRECSSLHIYANLHTLLEDHLNKSVPLL